MQCGLAYQSSPQVLAAWPPAGVDSITNLDPEDGASDHRAASKMNSQTSQEGGHDHPGVAGPADEHCKPRHHLYRRSGSTTTPASTAICAPITAMQSAAMLALTPAACAAATQLHRASDIVHVRYTTINCLLHNTHLPSHPDQAGCTERISANHLWVSSQRPACGLICR
jgi:hypothetical protein